MPTLSPADAMAWAIVVSRNRFFAAFVGGVLAITTTLWVHAQSPAGGAPDAAAGSTDGKTIYEARCADCHGVTGKGDGPASSLLRVRPRDFTLARFKLRSTESGALPTDADLYKSIKSGMHGSSMPDWAPFLADAQVQAVTSYIKSFSPRFATETPQPIAVGDPPVSSPEIIARGKNIYERLKCAACHGTDGTGLGAISTDLKDDRDRPTIATASHRAVDVSRGCHYARRLPSVSHRHERHADAVIQGRGDRCRAVAARHLRRVAGAKAGVGNDRRGDAVVLRSAGRAREGR